RGKGIATELLRHIIALSSKRGVHKIALHDTDMSRRIYEKEGFEISKNFFQLHLN
ncbi:MAG: GNAT family N-acetyltransferase, partial [Candidatus Thorarchaeota archaeon]|nr:GNAT family N-acetyltransferase [Candidatus Thorarchaeota archaeon]